MNISFTWEEYVGIELAIKSRIRELKAGGEKEAVKANQKLLKKVVAAQATAPASGVRPMNILIVTPEPIAGPKYIKQDDADIYFRSHQSGLKSITADLVILAPGCSPEQRQLALCRTKGRFGRVIHL